MNYSVTRETNLPMGPLQTFSRDEVEAWNWFCKAFPGIEGWRDWLNSTFRKALVRQAGQTLFLTQTSRTQASGLEHRFQQEHVGLGRGDENDIQLAGASISKAHARIDLRDNTFFLEDLGGALGTYLNQRKLTPREAMPLRSGDQIVIFPYTFVVRTEPVWAVESDVHLEASAPACSSFANFVDSTPAGYETYRITVLPVGVSAYLQVDAVLIHALLDRSLLPMGARGPQDLQGASNHGILELLMLAILRNLNAHLSSPYQFSLTHEQQQLLPRTSEKGVAALLSFGLTDIAAGGRVFAPYELFSRMMDTSPTVHRTSPLPPSVTWPFWIAAGNVTLTIDDIRHLERDDVVVFDALPELLFPKNFGRGWRIALNSGSPSSATLQRYFERKFTMGTSTPDSDADRNENLDLGGLPVMLHVIVAERELTLAEVNGLAPGTILPLERDKSSAVRLAVNGRTVGDGELVDIDGKLGVRIGKWSSS
jgi:flagellar motor switch/type III secretory pathway protein FliN